ncbi:MAG: hypothetical protein ACYC7A_03360 [Thermoanaerobaculia bacterium]
MGMDLRNDAGDTFQLNGTSWAFYLTLAERYGWSPKGTERPSDYPIVETWPGAYDRNDGQRVAADDASHLALALEDGSRDPHINRKSQALASELSESLRQATGDPEFFVELSEDYLEALCRLAVFVRKGSFIIE